MTNSFAHQIFMIRPRHFGLNIETAATNAFQSKILFESKSLIQQKAIDEFDLMVHQIEAERISVKVFADTDSPVKPDAVFPNNWISTHPGKKVVLYPMLTSNRQLEFRQDIVDWLQPNSVIDLRANQNEGKVLEGTGSMVLDHEAKVMYVSYSSRSNTLLAQKMADELGFELCGFHAVDHRSAPIYHTNVVLFVMKNYVVVGLETIKDTTERERLEKTILKSGKKILELDYYQITQFGGNMLQLQNQDNALVLVASNTAWGALSMTLKNSIQSVTKVIAVEIPIIEKYGGGSSRCMIVENFIHRE